MNISKHLFLSSVCAFMCAAAMAETAEFFESAFAAPASEKLVAQGQKAAELIGYEKPLEVASPKKAGIEINPVNKFIYGQINPQTQRAVIVANPEWLSLMPEEQQFFLMARALMLLTEAKPFSMQVIPYLFIILAFFLGLGFFFLLGKTALKNQKIWLRVILAIVLARACEFLVTNKLEAMVMRSLGKRFDIDVLESVIQKTHNRDAAIKALETYDAGIEEEYPNDPKYWTPYKGLFKEYAEALKKS